MEEIVKELLDLIKEQNKQIIELSKALADAKVSWQQPIEPQPSSIPLFYSAEEEDAEHLFKTGQIDKKTYEDLLKEAGFFSAEMVVPVPG